MPITAVVGAQWGDEGKGRLIDFLSAKSDIVARYAGGPNAGHTVMINDMQCVLHQVPSGVFCKNTVCVIGNGLVLDLIDLRKELEEVKQKGASLENRLFISDKAHLIMPYHKVLDVVKERKQQIGTTGRGIGPAYVDKVDRKGIRVCDLMNEKAFEEKLSKALEEKKELFSKIYSLNSEEMGEILEVKLANKKTGENLFRFFDEKELLSKQAILSEFLSLKREFEKYFTDTVFLLHNAIEQGKNVLVEGAQGCLLDIDLGTYPFVTSSSAASGGIASGLGIGVRNFDAVIGVAKAYATRVGGGPFPTELKDEIGERIAKKGKEFGATTGRKRRCGWLDIVILKYAIATNGITSFALTKLDVLDDLEKIKVCTHYELDGKKLEEFPSSIEKLEKCTPVFEEFEGWMQNTSNARKFEDLPKNAIEYIQAVEGFLKKPAKFISIGPERSQIIVR